MRELVYVSEATLSRFPLPQGLRRRVTGFGGKIPGVESRADLSAATGHLGLDRALRDFEASGRHARYYSEDGLAPGQWVPFEARLNYRVVPGGSHGEQSAALVFREPANADAPRLLLHSSPEHLVGARKAAAAETIGLPISPSAGQRISSTS
ncbi:hypothetical protein L3Q65_20725 [Amycolatopsis sp. FU40]|uniref:SAVMC3_10250 family protein n=1 Tax=Amycolatopsis sp. FU40 TaxID=2914159 RepID=UPI001F2D5074|nr:SAVMC3_10250 family protein [Amycolatopsis sp. FU40]UKD59044.1 hypothetical protein L3Q65_20725 [Amycolatopsis sp. FU40]